MQGLDDRILHVIPGGELVIPNWVLASLSQEIIFRQRLNLLSWPAAPLPPPSTWSLSAFTSCAMTPSPGMPSPSLNLADCGLTI